jgi:hypothetical protein
VIRTGIGAALLVFQLGAVVYARFTDARYFCWAPYDTQTEYTIEAALSGKALTAQEIRARYRRGPKGVDNRSPRHVQDILAGVETLYHPGDPAEVTLRYRINGHEEQVWRWPRR